MNHSKVMNCCICQDRFDSEERVPKVFPCGHMCCRQCVSDMLEVTGFGQSFCPQCRQPIPIKEVNEIPTAYQVISIVNEFNKLYPNLSEESPTVTIDKDYLRENFHVGTCEKHLNSPKNFGCETCQIWMCATCSILNHKNVKPDCKISLAFDIISILKSKNIDICVTLIEKNTATINKNNVDCLINQNESVIKYNDILERLKTVKTKLNNSTTAQDIEEAAEHLYFIKQTIKL